MKNTLYSALVLLTVLFPVWIQNRDEFRDSSSTDNAIQDVVKKLKTLQPPNIELDKLCSKADVVVIAKLVGKKSTDWSSLPLAERNPEIKLAVPMSNRMRVLGVLKGECDPNITVITAKWGEKAIVLFNYEFVEFFQTKKVPIDLETETDRDIEKMEHKKDSTNIEPLYLLFLRKIDGSYLPVTGLRYSGPSVFELNCLNKRPGAGSIKLSVK